MFMKSILWNDHFIVKPKTNICTQEYGKQDIKNEAHNLKLEKQRVNITAVLKHSWPVPY